MTKILARACSAAAVLAVAAAFTVAASPAWSADYPPCTSRTQDRCMQVPRSMMHKKAPMHRMKKEMGKEPMMKREGAMMDSGIPHGCSPATTPCGLQGGSTMNSGIPHGCSPATTPCQ